MSRVRFFSPRSDTGHDDIQHTADIAAEEKAEEANDGESSLAAALKDQLPWYLRPTKDQEELSPPMPAPKLPDLPAHPPPLLQPLLQHVSVDLGFDDVNLLDLRNIDPAPALGANVIMIVGTARSEKHLHVSADRLCRWLRSEHKLRPFADGLLGRNEIKLKKRRNMRKAKLLGASGKTPSFDVDDGIRTDWVCVNVGVVEPDPSLQRQLSRREGVVGFGSESHGVNVVVQLLTSHKREEIDLEGLWGVVLDDPPPPASDVNEHMPEAHALASNETIPQPSAVSRPFDRSPVESPFAARQQLRRLHVDTRPSEASSLSGSTRYPRLRIPNATDDALAFNEKEGDEIPAADAAEREQERSQLLTTMLSDIRGREQSEALRLLGKGSDDYSSTSFLSPFYELAVCLPPSRQWHFRMELHYLAIGLGHPGYAKAQLPELIRRMNFCAVDIAPETVLLALETVLCCRPSLKGVWPISGDSEANLSVALEVLEAVDYRGLEFMTEDVFVMFHKAVGFRFPVCAAAADSGSDSSGPVLPGAQRAHAAVLKGVHDRQTCLNVLMEQLQVRITKEENVLALLELYSNQARWDAFWDVWAMPPQQLLSRSPSMYVFLFDLFARLEHQSQAMAVLRVRLRQMVVERPPVPLAGDVARAVMRCLKVAHPPVEEEAHQVPFVKGEWVRWWRLCEEALGMYEGL